MASLAVKWTVANHLIFITAGKLLFSTRTETFPKRQFITFAIKWLSLAGLSSYKAIKHQHATPKRIAIALSLVSCSTFLFGWSASATCKKPLTVIHSTDAPQHIVTAGPYRMVRHPFYTSYLANFAAAAVISSSAWPLYAFIGATWTYWRAALAEEKKFDQGPLAQDYQNYRSRISMLVPFVL